MAQGPGGLEPRFSDDRQWYWNGSAWVPASQAPTPPPPPSNPSPGPAFAVPMAGAGAAATPTKKGHAGRNVAIGCGGLIVLIVIAAVAANAGSHNSPATSSSPVASSSSPVVSSAPKATAAAIAPIVLSGSGQQAVHFTVTQGLSILTAKCSCSSNFIVEVDDSTGKTVDIPINVIGQYSGSVGEPLNAGGYILKIDADAAWSVTVTQPRNVSGSSLPQTYTSSGQQNVGPFSAGSAVGVKAHNAGSSNFIVSVLDKNGAVQDIPINVIGNYDGSTISNNLSNGPFYLNVDSDGTWTITVSKP